MPAARWRDRDRTSGSRSPTEMRARPRARARAGAQHPAARGRAPDWPRDRAPPRRAPVRPRPARSRSAAPSARNFATGPSSLPLTRLSRRSPMAPAVFASASISSSCLRDSAAPPGTTSPRTRPPCVERRTRDAEFRAAEHVAHVGDLESVPEVRAVAAVALHRVGVRHARERRRHGVAGFAPQRGDQPLGERDDVLRRR